MEKNLFLDKTNYNWQKDTMSIIDKLLIHNKQVGIKLNELIIKDKCSIDKLH